MPYPHRVVVTQASVVLYGHTARIWDAMIISTGIVSVGEVEDIVIPYCIVSSVINVLLCSLGQILLAPTHFNNFVVTSDWLDYVLIQ